MLFVFQATNWCGNHWKDCKGATDVLVSNNFGVCVCSSHVSFDWAYQEWEGFHQKLAEDKGCSMIRHEVCQGHHKIAIICFALHASLHHLLDKSGFDDRGIRHILAVQLAYHKACSLLTYSVSGRKLFKQWAVDQTNRIFLLVAINAVDEAVLQHFLEGKSACVPDIVMALLEEHSFQQVQSPCYRLWHRWRYVLARIFEVLLKFQGEVSKQAGMKLQKLKATSTLRFGHSK